MAYLFDKQKVAVKVFLSTNPHDLREVESLAAPPGTIVYGRLDVEVKASVTITNVRVNIEGKGKTQVTVGSGDSRRTYYDSHLHYSHRVICFGFDNENGDNKGRVELAEGNHSYPFTFILPNDIPPSTKMSGDDCKTKVFYTITGVVDIPNGFDRRLEVPLIVPPVVPLQQLVDAYQNTAALDRYETVPTASCRCCGCFCCRSDEDFVDVNIVVFPRVFMYGLDPATQSALSDIIGCSPIPPDFVSYFPNGLPPNSIGVVVSMVNHTHSEELSGVEIAVKQKLECTVKGYTRNGSKTLGSATVKDQYIGPGESGRFPAVIDLTHRLQKGDVQPAVDTPHANLQHLVTVKSRGVTVADMMFPRLPIAAAVNMENRVPQLPASHRSTTVVPTNTYLASGR